MPFPMRCIDQAPNQSNVAHVESTSGELAVIVPQQQIVENGIGTSVGDSEIAFVGLSRLEIGARRLIDQLLGHAEVAG